MGDLNLGFTCFRCRASLETPFCGPDYDKADAFAGSHGWHIGHWDGQGQYVCGDCKDTIWDAIPLNIELEESHPNE